MIQMKLSPLRIISKQEMIVGGIGVPFRVLDAYNTWFDEFTDYALDLFPQKPVFVDHGLSLVGRGGDVLRIEVHREGLYGEARLLENEVGLKAFRLVESGRGFWSTGVLPHLMRFRESDGYAERWPIVEWTVTDRPASRREIVQVKHLRSLVDVGDLPDDSYLRRSLFAMPDNPVNGGPQSPQNSNGDSPPANPPPAAAAPSTPPAASTTDQQIATLTQSVASLQQSVSDLANMRNLPPAAPPPAAPRIQVSSKYDRVSLLGMLFRDSIQKSYNAQHQRPHRYDEEFMRALLDKVSRQWKIDSETETPSLPGEMIPVGYRMIDHIAYEAWHGKIPHLRSDEAMQATLAGSGDELVPTMLSTVAYYAFLVESKVMGLFEKFMMPSNPFDYPAISGGPSLRAVAAAANQSAFTIAASPYPTSKPTTAKVTFTAGKVGALTLYNEELVEESGINVADMLATQYVRNVARDLDKLLLHGDETASVANISHLGTDPTATAYDWILQLDGLRHMSLITDNNEQEDTAVAIEAINAVARANMGTGGNLGLDPLQLAAIVDKNVYYDLLALSGFQDMQEVGEIAVKLTGEVARWYNVPVIVSDEMENTNATGQIEDSHDSTLGSWLCVHRPSIKIGLLRDIDTRSFEVPWADSHAMMTTVRLDIQKFETGAVLASYNVGGS